MTFMLVCKARGVLQDYHLITLWCSTTKDINTELGPILLVGNIWEEDIWIA